MGVGITQPDPACQHNRADKARILASRVFNKPQHLLILKTAPSCAYLGPHVQQVSSPGHQSLEPWSSELPEHSRGHCPGDPESLTHQPRKNTPAITRLHHLLRAQQFAWGLSHQVHMKMDRTDSSFLKSFPNTRRWDREQAEKIAYMKSKQRGTCFRGQKELRREANALALEAYGLCQSNVVRQLLSLSLLELEHLSMSQATDEALTPGSVARGLGLAPGYICYLSAPHLVLYCESAF
ncbi:putative Global Transcription Activator Snf2L2 [Manis pentadactyla]|nr:putative Global Transcription Activator Snf2L2 [Manis pentadactyla]